jgi:hypothetical protein
MSPTVNYLNTVITSTNYSANISPLNIKPLSIKLLSIKPLNIRPLNNRHPLN